MFLRTIRRELLWYICSSWPAKLSPACLIGILQQQFLLVLSAQCLSEDQLSFTSQTSASWVKHQPHRCDGDISEEKMAVSSYPRLYFMAQWAHCKYSSLLQSLCAKFKDVELRCSGDVALVSLILLRGINIIVIIIINHHPNKFFKDVLVPEPSSSIFPGILHLNLSSLAPNVPSADLWIQA